MDVIADGWSGEGSFTASVLEHLRTVSSIDLMRVEDAPASRADEGFSFISNEIFVRFRQTSVAESTHILGIIPVRRYVQQPVMTLVDLEAHLTMADGVGPPDYADESMLQYLRTERIIPPYQTRGYKIIEMVRIYVLKP